MDDDYVLQNRVKPLLQVVKVDLSRSQVTLNASPAMGPNQAKHPLLRRRDQKAGDPSKGELQLCEGWGTAIIKEGQGDKNWLTLEDGIQIQFQAAGTDELVNQYRSGDYWLVPARTAIADVLWLQSEGTPKAVPPHGVQHHYAPLAIINLGADGKVSIDADCRPKFQLPIRFSF